MPTATGYEPQRDKSREDARRERVRAQAELRSRCPASFERLEQFATQSIVGRLPDDGSWLLAELREAVGPMRRDGVDQAAEEVLAAVQQELSKRSSSSPLPWHVATVFAKARFDAINALDGGGYAKRALQQAAAPSRPLMVCTGHTYLISRSATPDDPVDKFNPRGCGAIFPESPKLSGNNLWAMWCPACRSSHKKPSRQRDALRKRLYMMAMRAKQPSESLRLGTTRMDDAFIEAIRDASPRSVVHDESSVEIRPSE